VKWSSWTSRAATKPDFCEQEAKLMEMAMIFGLFVGVGLTLVLPALAGMRHRERPSGSA
jgi:hypothetical protein